MRTIVTGMALIMLASTVPAADLVFEQVGYNYVPAASHPHQYEYELRLTNVDPLQPVNDFHLDWPLYNPGALIINAPQGWVGQEQFGNEWEMGFWADDEQYWVSEDGSLGGWEIQGQNPQLVGGYAKVTYNGTNISNNFQVLLPIAPEPATCLLLLVGMPLLRRR